MKIFEELVETLRDAGVGAGDTLCIYSDITSFGIPESIRDDLMTKGMDVLPEVYVNSFESLVGEKGTLMMPTYTYSACNDELFDVGETPCILGVLPEYFRKQPGVQRSVHPVFSFAAKGPRAEPLLQVDDFDCFSEKSIFGKLYDDNVYYLIFGVEFERGAGFVYLAEQKAKVPYRMFKNFTGKIRDVDGSERVVDVRFLVRKSLSLETQWYKFERIAIDEGVVKELFFNGGKMLLVRAQEIEALLQRELKKDEYCLIKKETL